MLSQYFFILVMSGLAVVLPLAAIVMGHFLGPRRPDEIKNDIYESGVETIGETWVQFRAQYYLIGLVFVVFDVEALFLFPIALAYTRRKSVVYSRLPSSSSVRLGGFPY